MRALLAASILLLSLVGSAPHAGATVGAPSWWNGACDAGYWNGAAAAKGWHGAGAHALGASYLGVPVCGPRPAEDGAPDILWRRPGWGELEFECVELAMRFMAQVYGVAPYGANGDGVVRNYTTADGGGLVKIANGTAHVAPQPGDVISFDSPNLGHVGVVTASSVDNSGNGSLTMLSQNDTTNGWRTLSISNWVVASFGNDVPYGWLHDPAGRGRIAGPPTGPGYWMLGTDGMVYPFGGVYSYGPAATGAVAIAPRPNGDGYWIVDGAGAVTAAGGATNDGGSPALNAGESVTTIAATPSGHGYWLFTNRGRAIPYGDAQFYGDMQGKALNGPVIASAATPTGRGYYMVGSDGGIFTFGDAVFRGSMGGVRLNRPVVGIAPTPDNSGYWLVASDGGVFSFRAPFRGSMGGTALNRPVNGMVAFGNGYLMVASDGGVFDFSNKPFLGSLGSNPPAAPVTAIAAFAN